MTVPLLPDAIANSESFVEHSPSTVIALKVSRADSTSARCSIAGGTCASVVMNPSIVAMFGSIIPDPFAIAPTTNDPRDVVTRTECSFGNGSVVMIARAASPPLPRASAEHACWIPGMTRSIGSPTPMTPVDATRTCSGGHPSASATCSVIRFAFASPSAPVHAFAHPLLTTMAHPTPCVASRCCLETSTGAACARFVVKIPAIEANVSVAMTARSRASGFALIPQCSAADLKPVGAVIPPSTGVMEVCRAAGITSAMQGSQRDAGAPRALEGAHHRVLSAAAELAAGLAVGGDLLGNPRVRHDRKPEVNEVRRRVREGAQLLEPCDRGAPYQLVDDASADATAACFTADGKRTDFRDGTAEGRQFCARNDFVILHRDDEAVRVDADLVELARKQVAFGKVLVDELVDRIGIVGRGVAQRDRCVADAPCPNPKFRIPNPRQRQKH